MTFGKVLGLAALGVGTVVSGGSVLGVVAGYAIYRKKEKENDKKRFLFKSRGFNPAF